MNDTIIYLILSDLKKLFERLPEEAYKKEVIEGILDWIALDSIGSMGNRGFFYHPLRVALTGKENSPSPQEIIPIIGKKAVLERIQEALNKMDNDKESE